MEGCPMHVDFRPAEKQRFEERKAHKVIPVAVGEQKIVAITPLIN